MIGMVRSMSGAKPVISLIVILSTLSGCKMSSTISNYCFIYEPVRNYLDAPQAVIDQINENNAYYLELCK